jgi:xylulokinase
VTPNSAFVSLGTSGVLFVSNRQFSPNPDSAVHAFCHSLPNTWHQMGVILSAAGSIEWLSSVTGTSAADLAQSVEGKANEPGSLLYLPYLSGERTPHNNARARGSFVGLGAEMDKFAMARAVMEGVAFAFADNLMALRAAGTEIERATAVGGGSRSCAWLQIIANTLDLPIDVPAEGDFGGAFGAARLGLIAAKAPTRFRSAARLKFAGRSSHMRAAEAYARAHQRYRARYPAIKEAIAS